MKILVLGPRGNIGHFLYNHLSKTHSVIGLSKELLDIRNRDNVLLTIKKLSPEIIVQAAGIGDIDFCEQNEKDAYETNTLGTLNIASVSNLLNIPLVYISSGYVYGEASKSQLDENYSFIETDKCEPTNMYAKSKLAGEKLIQTLCNKYFILRTSWCFGGNNCYVKKVLQNINIPTFMSSTDIVNPTSLYDLSHILEKLIETDLYGIYNCVNNGFTAKDNVIKFIFDYLDIEKEVRPLPEDTRAVIAPRPRYSNINPNKVEKALNIKIPTWQEALKKYLI
ncbi:dTDP-4-dehydrorhamnose reductase [Clostridium cavendishii DSM 21758]|uniref:dTDP-4-dehydrorhamnose reductase n=1 Tax=Clostridium cavendishii DSM 21758 TaxID=1121302 RepID=A0A1M6EST6_9CLOT|nr:NAD(P)-dependent oxidoreductase [Clostridium cavendishii]SHI88488.1 dTDP-4-dehydrorhamnose reductase [Clostridium cavendishii DSM 21758]